jgi:hypothetical protein
VTLLAKLQNLFAKLSPPGRIKVWVAQNDLYVPTLSLELTCKPSVGEIIHFKNGWRFKVKEVTHRERDGLQENFFGSYDPDIVVLGEIVEEIEDDKSMAHV